MGEYKTYVVRPKISATDQDPVGKGLAAHGMSKFAGCPDVIFGAAFDRQLKRYLTGLDETHPDILILPAEEREAKQAEIIAERVALEKEIGESLEHTNTKYWEELKIVLDRGKSFTTRNPEDRIIIKVLQAGDMVPFSKEEVDNPKYAGCNYYIGTEFEDVTEKTQSRSKDRKVSIELEKLLDKTELAIEIGKYLGIEGVVTGVPRANLDDLISTFLEKKPSNKEAFLEVVAQTEEFIRLYNLFQEFRLLQLVRFEDGRWMSGKVKLGKTDKESVKNLCSTKPEMQAEKSKLLEEHKELLDSKRKK